MTRSIWSRARASLVVGMALIGGACAASPELSDTPGPASTAPIAAAKPAPKPTRPSTTTTTTRPPSTTLPPTTVPPTTTSTVAVTAPPQSYAAASTQTSIGGCQLFPPDHYLNARNIDRLPLHPRSAAWTTFLARDGETLHTPSGDLWQGARSGMPINVVDSRTTPMVDVMIDPHYSGNNHTGGYPIPAKPRLEGYPSAQWDRHLLMVDTADCSAYELIQYDPTLARLFGIHKALAGTKYSLNTSEQPVKTTNAAQTPMVGQYAMIDEVQAGRIAHALGACSTQLSKEHTWPARRSDGKLTSPDAPPMGAWLRLRGDVDPDDFSGQARVLVRALREHGMILTDTCGHQFALLAENSDAWNKADMAQLGRLTARHFEVVDPTPMRGSTSSFRVN